MHILTLGGNGFIGSHFVDRAVAAGHEVSVLSRKPLPIWPHGRPFRHLPGGFEALAAHPDWLDGVDAVCHGAWSTVPKTAAADPQGDVITNVVGTLRVLDMINAAGVEHLLFLSSGGAVYGRVKGYAPIREDQPLNPIGAYGIGKMAAEKYILAHAEQTGLKATIIRPSNPYGPGQSSLGVLGVVTTFLHHALAGTPATIFGDGEIVRDFFDVRDLAALMLTALEQPAPGVYNCGSGTGNTLLEVVEAIQAATGRELRLERLPARPFDPARIVLDVSRAREAFGWRPEISVEDGIINLMSNFEKAK